MSLALLWMKKYKKKTQSKDKHSTKNELFNRFNVKGREKSIVRSNDYFKHLHFGVAYLLWQYLNVWIFRSNKFVATLCVSVCVSVCAYLPDFRKRRKNIYRGKFSLLLLYSIVWRSPEVCMTSVEERFGQFCWTGLTILSQQCVGIYYKSIKMTNEKAEGKHFNWFQTSRFQFLFLFLWCWNRQRYLKCYTASKRIASKAISKQS